MDIRSKDFKIFSVLPYKISEELFKEKVGSGDTLKNLIENKIVTYDEDKIRVNNNSEYINSLIESVSVDEKLEMHKMIIEEFYFWRVKYYKCNDYKEFMDEYESFINLAYHLRELKRYDDSIKYIFLIAKKLIFWGQKTILIDELEKFDDNQIILENKLNKYYYLLFADIIVPSNQALDLNKISKQFDEFNQLEKMNFKLYLKCKNLEGVFEKNYKNNIETTLNIYTQLIKKCKNTLKYGNKDIEVILSHILQNMAICYINTDLDKAIEIVGEAEKYISKYEDENYELLKLILNKLVMFRIRDTNDLDFMEYLGKFREISGDFMFPDIERRYYNLLAEMVFEDESIEEFFELKSYVLIRDLFLYDQYFILDFVSVLNKIKPYIKNKSKQIIPGLNIISSVLEEYECMDEYMFIEALKSFIKGKGYKRNIAQINNSSLVDIFNKYITS